jgi:hypothetical protein
MEPNTRKWITGLISVVSGGILTALGNMGVAPETFNFSTTDGIQKLGLVVAIATVIAILNYIKQFPAPAVEETKTVEVSKTTTTSVAPAPPPPEVKP